MKIQLILDAVRSHRLRISDHADEEATNDGLGLDFILASIERGEIIEDYPDDTPYPSCLVLGWDSTGRPIHSVWAYDESSAWVVLVTVYAPDPTRWVNWRERRPRS